MASEFTLNRFLSERDRLPGLFVGTISRSAPQPQQQSSYAPTSSYMMAMSPTETDTSCDDSLFTRPASPLRSNTISSSAPTDTGIIYDYRLPCEFESIGCQVDFDPHGFEHWISHSITHLSNILPLQALCIFCDSFVFQETTNPLLNWRRRMLHIRDHHAGHAAPSRPDFWLLDHMFFNNLISREDYEYARSFTERPQCLDLNLVSYDFETPEKKEERQRASRVPVDMEKEERRRRRAAQNDKGKGAREASHKSRKHRVLVNPT